MNQLTAEQVIRKVKCYIQEHNLIKEGDKIIVAVSGGADSVALLDILYCLKEEYKLALEVAHVHHGARSASDEEEAYVQRISRKLGILCHVHRCNIKVLAKQYKQSEEVVGRQERYKFFISLTNPCDKIATAHTVNDQAETLLMRFFRGSGIKGLGGIPKKRDYIIRPLLCLTREEIEQYCRERHLQYYNDESNFTTQYTRNKVRLECIPYIQENMNPNIIQTLAHHAELYQQEEDFLQDYVDKLYEDCVKLEGKVVTMNLERLKAHKIYIQKRLMIRGIQEVARSTTDLSLVHINQCMELINKQSGKQMSLPNGLTIKRIYNDIRISQNEEVIFTNHEIRLTLGINNIEPLDTIVMCHLVDRKTFELSKENIYTKYIDYDKIKDTLCIRTRKKGDLIVLEHGSKKLKKLLIDEKVPSSQRDQLPIIVHNDDIVWVVGVRLSSQYFVTKDTKNILEIKILNQEVQEGLC